MSHNFKRQVKQIRCEVFQQMLKSRRRKYRVFLFFLHLFKFASFSPKRGEFLETYYAIMRLLDDIVDGDAPLPHNYNSEYDYIQEKIDFVENPNAPSDKIEILLQYCFHLSELMGKNFYSETIDILKSLQFDAIRRRKYTIYPNIEINEHFYIMDIRGTIRATLKIFNEEPNKYELLKPLGMACRYQSDIEDFQEDLKAGYINISQEECRHFCITFEDMIHQTNGLQKWIKNRAISGLELLSKHRKNIEDGNFSFLSKLTFYLVYELPAKRAFKKAIKSRKK